MAREGIGTALLIHYECTRLHAAFLSLVAAPKTHSSVSREHVIVIPIGQGWILDDTMTSLGSDN